MNVRDVMVTPVITVKPFTTVKEAAELFLARKISATPVVDSEQKLVGIVSEGDLLHRVEAGTERHRSWWLEEFIGNDTLAAEYVKAHGRKVSDVMTRKVITASPQTPLHEVADFVEQYRRFWEQSLNRLEDYLRKLQPKGKKNIRKKPARKKP